MKADKKAKKGYAPKLIGIALIILALVAYLSGEIIGTIISFVAGLILLLSPKKVSSQALDSFINSFKLKKEFFLIALYDALFYLSAFVLLWLFSILMKAPFESLGLARLQESLASQEILQANIKAVQAFFAWTAIAFVLFLFLLIISYTFFKGLIWLTMLTKKPSFIYFKKFFFTNLVWALIWVVPAVLALFGLKPEFFTFVAIIEFVLYLHLTSILHLSFAKKRDIAGSYSKILSIGFKKIHYFIVPYVYALIVYLIISQVFRIIPQERKLILAFAVLFVLFYLAWFRHYIKDVIEGIEIKT